MLCSGQRLASYFFTFLLFCSPNYLYIHFLLLLAWAHPRFSLFVLYLYICASASLFFFFSFPFVSYFVCLRAHVFRIKAFLPSLFFCSISVQFNESILGSFCLYSANLFIPFRKLCLFPLPKDLGLGVTSKGAKDAATSLMSAFSHACIYEYAHNYTHVGALKETHM